MISQNHMKKKLVMLGSVFGLTPLVAFAAVTCTGVGSGTIQFIICKAGDILNAVIPVLVVLGIVYFVWGVITYVISSDEEAKKAGRNRIIFGIIGLAVIVAMWGLVNILINTFSLNSNTGVTLPTVVIP
jgi:hypothetical protein